MATKSFLKNITINNHQSATKFVNALEYAANKNAKVVKIDKKVEDIKDRDKIKEIFKK